MIRGDFVRICALLRWWSIILPFSDHMECRKWGLNGQILKMMSNCPDFCPLCTSRTKRGLKYIAWRREAQIFWNCFHVHRKHKWKWRGVVLLPRIFAYHIDISVRIKINQLWKHRKGKFVGQLATDQPISWCVFSSEAFWYWSLKYNSTLTNTMQRTIPICLEMSPTPLP